MLPDYRTGVCLCVCLFVSLCVVSDHMRLQTLANPFPPRRDPIVWMNIYYKASLRGKSPLSGVTLALTHFPSLCVSLSGEMHHTDGQQRNRALLPSLNMN